MDHRLVRDVKDAMNRDHQPQRSLGSRRERLGARRTSSKTSVPRRGRRGHKLYGEILLPDAIEQLPERHRYVLISATASTTGAPQPGRAKQRAQCLAAAGQAAPTKAEHMLKSGCNDEWGEWVISREAPSRLYHESDEACCDLPRGPGVGLDPWCSCWHRVCQGG